MVPYLYRDFEFIKYYRNLHRNLQIQILKLNYTSNLHKLMKA